MIDYTFITRGQIPRGNKGNETGGPISLLIITILGITMLCHPRGINR